MITEFEDERIKKQEHIKLEKAKLGKKNSSRESVVEKRKIDIQNKIAPKKKKFDSKQARNEDNGQITSMDKSCIGCRGYPCPKLHKILAASTSTGEFSFLISVVVPAEEAKVRWPEAVISFCEERLLSKSDDEIDT